MIAYFKVLFSLLLFKVTYKSRVPRDCNSILTENLKFILKYDSSVLPSYKFDLEPGECLDFKVPK